MTIEGFNCEIKVKPMEEWVQIKDEDVCPPCIITPLAQYYLATLQEKAPEQAKALEKAWDTADILTIAQAMDNIKKEVGDNLKKELEGFDCFAQSFKH